MDKEYNNLFYKLKNHGVTIYAVAKAGGWSWQQVAAWVKGSRAMQMATFFALKRVLTDNFGIEIEITDLEKEKGGKE